MSITDIKNGTFSAPGTRTIHVAMPDFGVYVTATPQTLDIDVKPDDTWLAAVHIDKRTIQGMETAPDALSALEEGLRMVIADCEATIEEINERFFPATS